MIDKEPAIQFKPSPDKFDSFTGTDGETYSMIKPEFAAEYAQLCLRRMVDRAKHTKEAMERYSLEQSSLV